jgi:predicted  nucleic acid-binding Zn-ribbon protein
MQYKDIEAALADFDSETERNSAEFARLTEQIETKRSEIASVNEEIVKLYGNITLLQNDIQHNIESMERLNGDIDELKASDSDAKSEIEAKLSLYSKKVADVEKLEAELSPKGVFISDVFSASGTNIGAGMICANFFGEPISENSEVEKEILTAAIEACR